MAHRAPASQRGCRSLAGSARRRCWPSRRRWHGFRVCRLLGCAAGSGHSGKCSSTKPRGSLAKAAARCAAPTMRCQDCFRKALPPVVRQTSCNKAGSLENRSPTPKQEVQYANSSIQTDAPQSNIESKGDVLEMQPRRAPNAAVVPSLWLHRAPRRAKAARHSVLKATARTRHGR